MTGAAGPTSLEEPRADRVILRSAGRDSAPAGTMGAVFFAAAAPGSCFAVTEPSAAIGGGALEVEGISDLEIPLRGEASGALVDRGTVIVAPGRSIAECPAGSVTLWLGDTVFILGVASVDPVGDVLSTVPGAVPEARALLPLVSSVVVAVAPEDWDCVAEEPVALPDDDEAVPEAVEVALPELLPLPAPEPPLWAKQTALQRPATTIKVLAVVIVFFMGREDCGIECGIVRPCGGRAAGRFCSHI